MSFEIAVEVARGEALVRAAFAAPPGLTALFGPSGAGKTTVLDMVAGLLRPARGRIVAAGTVLFDSAAGIDVPAYRRRAGYVFQDRRLFPHLSVRDNLLYGWRRAPAAARPLGLDEVLAWLGIAHLAPRAPRTLSGGEAQRVAIGRALLSGPRFLLLDEPLAALDRARREDILRLIERLRDELALPILYVSHDRAELERLGARIIALEAG